MAVVSATKLCSGAGGPFQLPGSCRQGTEGRENQETEGVETAVGRLAGWFFSTDDKWASPYFDSEIFTPSIGNSWRGF
jgi:hypothetical protein